MYYQAKHLVATGRIHAKHFTSPANTNDVPGYSSVRVPPLTGGDTALGSGATTRKTRIIVADGHSLYCEGIAALLKNTPDIEVVCHVSTGEQVLQRARESKPDLILMDASLPPSGGVEVTRLLRVEEIDSKVLLLTQYEREIDLLSGFRTGVNGLISKQASYSDLVSAIYGISRGDYVVHLSLDAAAIGDYFQGLTQKRDQHGDGVLSHREREILELMANGSRTGEIASSLGITAKTVSGHRANMMKKLAVHSQAELVKYAVLNSLLRIGSLENRRLGDAK